MIKEIFEQINLIHDVLYSGDYQKIENALRIAEQWLYIEADKEKIENTQEFQLGRLDGYIEACEDMYHLNRQTTIIENNLSERDKKILEYINLHEIVSHNDLAKAMNISCSELSDIMKRILFTKAAKYTNVGKNTAYYLSEVGKSIITDRILT